MTAVANATFTAAQFNQYVRDNLNETGPAKATVGGRILVTTGANSITERGVPDAKVATSEGTASTTYVALATPGPSVTLTTGARAAVFVTTRMSNGTATGRCAMSYAVSGSSAIAADDTRATIGGTNPTVSRQTAVYLETTLTPGSNTFTAQYKAVTAGTATFQDRHILVIGL